MHSLLSSLPPPPLSPPPSSPSLPPLASWSWSRKLATVCSKRSTSRSATSRSVWNGRRRLGQNGCCITRRVGGLTQSYVQHVQYVKSGCAEGVKAGLRQRQQRSETRPSTVVTPHNGVGSERKTSERLPARCVQHLFRGFVRTASASPFQNKPARTLHTLHTAALV